ncbi:hypothetical protein QBC47DRAFT_15099 [Echria macrotheca]|uniref:Uncharacterized protein n=1 Tax=Echria macrotheca TaxID=438768 RepID=A0AAJ0BMW5_9PEZI|nr:hypothetical protein QBC47DRAFT_15099 [Echria macrotheca]
MSLPAASEPGYIADMPTTSTPDSKTEPIFPDAVVYSNFYSAEDHDTMPPSAKRPRADTAPELPQKSALRASRLLDNLGLKLGGSMETTTEPGQATPLDVYLSSEEDASSDADDFSDYGYDSSVDDPTSPTTLQQPRSRSSHEDTARVVSVIYSGKPSIIDLTVLRRRSTSPNSIETRTRSSTVSSATRTPVDRPSTPASSVSSPVQPARKGSLLSDLLVKKRPPPFLSIDPYANGSTYSLDAHKHPERPTEDESPNKPPKTPTQLLKGMSRTFSLVKKRSRPLLRTDSPQPVQTNFSSISGPSPLSASDPPALSAGPSEADVDARESAVDSPQTPQTPVTYNDILRAAKKNAMMSPPSPSIAQTPISPMSPQGGAKRGILSGLAARRRSIKLTGRVLG